MADATVMEHADEAQGRQQYATFSLNNEEYAIPALLVQEIIELTHITMVPRLPCFIRGVINLRGTIIPVIDLKMKLGLAGGPYQRHTCVIIVTFSRGAMGLIVDTVTDVAHLPKESVTLAPSFGDKVRTDYISGLGRLGDRLFIILDIENVLSTDEASLAASLNNQAITPPATGPVSFAVPAGLPEQTEHET